MLPDPDRLDQEKLGTWVGGALWAEAEKVRVQDRLQGRIGSDAVGVLPLNLLLGTAAESCMLKLLV